MQSYTVTQIASFKKPLNFAKLARIVVKKEFKVKTFQQVAKSQHVVK